MPAVPIPHFVSLSGFAVAVHRQSQSKYFQSCLLCPLLLAGRFRWRSDIPNMFQRFSQGTSKKRSAGTGLGLYLSRQIIESHGGKIWLESKINKGSEFSFILTDVVKNPEKERLTV